ncbi:Ger(x)C family spore germination protein [Brevibacillus choshinensis]|uniref:Ger(X)C family spore germination protein n=1 Tax=Brevibacillus choshinensis TaxID=54911 RepID=A0ABX7FM79_BRECH|nr:Ger(x)C family spore germination protein [Brevibacillus choshinensis]QRG66381.1 Ger(x)C family spore germination protein [Brevibacillus choshinensis]
MVKRVVAGLLVIALSLAVTGCWDQVQIEERGFVIGVAVDFPRNTKAEEQALQEAPDKPVGQNRFLITTQLVIPGGLIASGQSSGSGQNTANEAFLNLVSEGDSMFEVGRELATRSSRTPFYQHLKVTIISEEVARSKDGFANAIDVTLRDPDSRRSSKVYISKGDAKSIMDVKPKTEKLPALYIDSVGKNNDRNARMLPDIRLGDVHQQLLNHFSFAIPRITAEKQEVKLAGAAVFNADNQLVGFLGEEETEGLNFLTGKVRGGVLKTKFNNDLVVLNVQGARKTIKADVRDREHMKFTFNIECEGAIMESFIPIDLLDEKTLQKLESSFAREIERMSKDTISKVHEEMPVDVLRIGRYLKQYHNKLWKQIERDWENGRQLYKKSEITVKAQVFIRNNGGINKTENKTGR